jgi:hypothetical protein
MPNSLHTLQRIFQTECRSFAHYIGESSPWTRDRDQPAKELLRSILADERRWAGQLAEIINARHGRAVIGSYPDRFIQSNLHFVDMHYLMQRLADNLLPEIQSLRSDLQSVANDVPARTLIEQMIERKTGQVEAIRKLPT